MEYQEPALWQTPRPVEKNATPSKKGKSLTDGQVVDTTHPWYGARVGIIGDSISDPKRGERTGKILLVHGAGNRNHPLRGGSKRAAME